MIDRTVLEARWRLLIKLNKCECCYGNPTLNDVKRYDQTLKNWVRIGTLFAPHSSRISKDRSLGILQDFVMVNP